MNISRRNLSEFHVDVDASKQSIVWSRIQGSWIKFVSCKNTFHLVILVIIFDKIKLYWCTWPSNHHCVWRATSPVFPRLSKVDLISYSNSLLLYLKYLAMFSKISNAHTNIAMKIQLRVRSFWPNLPYYKLTNVCVTIIFVLCHVK